MGLSARLMGRWEKNEHFTYGYGRVETLSGFANAIFLILISVFIAFEAVQRLLVPVLILISSDANHSYSVQAGPPRGEHEPAALGQLRRLGWPCSVWRATSTMYVCLHSPKPCTELLNPRAIRTLIGLVTLIMVDAGVLPQATKIITVARRCGCHGITPVQHTTLGRS